MSVSSAALTPRELTLSGVNSYDPDANADGGSVPVSSWRFTLLPPVPAGVTTSNLAHHNTVITTPLTTLSLPAGSNGTYRVSLTVYDSANQASLSTTLVINVSP